MVQQIRALQGYPGFFPDGSIGNSIVSSTPVATTTEIVYRNAISGESTVFRGTFTLDGGGNVTGGTVSGFDVSAGATLIESATGFSFSATSLLAAVTQFQSMNLGPFLQLLFTDISFLGSSADDYTGAFSGVLAGRGGDDDLYQIDSMYAPGGYITLRGGKGDDGLYASANTIGAELYGGQGNDYLEAGSGPSILKGGQGNDVLSDGDGPAHLSGNKGDDFIALWNLNLDFLDSFNAKHDTIGLNVLEFEGVHTGFLTAGEFVKGTVATTPDQHILYDKSTGNALYDADGSGGIAPVVFAVLPAHLKLHAHNFVGFLDQQ